MSGDVQPRKRKDKKKRRDDESSHGVHITKMGNEDVHLHVQHEHGTGGHWCAKIFFFSLLAILFGLVALIILENRGISDLDTPLSESRFSNYFDGWVDESRQEHDDHHPLQASKEDHDEHDEPFEEEEDHSELDEDADEEHDEDDDHDDEDDEDATTEQTKELEEDENNDERDEENDDGDDDDEDEEEDATKEAILEQTNEEEDDDENENDNNTEEEDDDNITQEATTKEEDDRADADDDNDNDDGDADGDDDEGENNTNEQTVEASQEANEDDNNDSAYDKNEDDNNDDDDDADDVEPSYERSTQQITTSQQSETNKANDDDDDDAFDEEDDDDTFDSIENVVDNDAEELLLLQEKARKQAAEAAKNEPASTEKDKNEDTAEAVPSWASSQIKPKEDIGGGPQAQNDELGMFERELRRANEEMMRENYAEAIKRFDQLARQYPDKPQVFLAQARLLDKLADRKHSNDLLSQALQAYKRYLALDGAITDNVEFRIVAERCIERMRFMGHHMQAVPIHRQLIKRFADEPNVRNQLAITYLLQNRLSYAKSVLQVVLSRWPNDGFAQAHYGFVLRQLDLDYANAVIYLRKGIDSKATGTQDGRFYFNLGDSLQRLGRQAEAVEVYRRGAALKLFPSVYQRSLYNEPNLLAKPYWTKAETTYESYFNKLELNWRTIRDEALSLLSRRGYFLDEAESLRDTGNWQQFELYARGQQRVQNCRKAPITCGLIEKFSAAAGCRRGQVKFSVMQPGTHVHAHCGPTNCRLRAHLGLVVPEGTRLRVAEEERTWTEGQILIFDDSFEHEVWHNGSSFRLVLIVDVWHPDLSAQQRRTLSPI